MSRTYNFSAGPSMLPVPALEKAASQMLDYEGSGLSVMEMSHRSKEYTKIIQDTESALRRVLSIPDNYKVLFMQGGATMQFSAIPLNLSIKGKADYFVTGNFSNLAMKEAKKFTNVTIAASSEAANFTYIPKGDQVKLDPDADYVYICSNNTIYGTEFHELPDTGSVPLIADVSSHILSRPMDISKYGMIYAGAQKNMGPAGVTVAIIREDLLGNYKENMPVLLDYALMAKNDSLYNTPPSYAIYMLGLVLEWLENLGGLESMEQINIEKAQLLYDYLDGSTLFEAVANKEDRSRMNVTFRTNDADLDAKFCKEAALLGLQSLKGHRSVGGMRASIYNAMPREGIVALIDFMKKFETENN